MGKINNKEIQVLKKAAHHLSPVVYIGSKGLTDSLINSIDEALDAHELIKIKFNDYKTAKEELSRQIVDRVNAVCISIVGNIVIIYRMNEHLDKRNYLKS